MISVVIPCYNMRYYISDCIESVFSQTLPPYEIIVVDDGSIDGSKEIIDGYKLTVVHQVNKGLASARNTGIMHASGDYILFLDADDILKENAIERLTQVIQNTNADIIAPSFKCFGLSQDEVILMEHPTIEDFKVANRIGYCAAVKRTALLEVGGYNPKMTWGAEDYDLWFDLLKRGKNLVTIPDVLWLYRVRESSMWTETAKHQEAFMAQIKKNHPEVYDRDQ